LGERRVRNAEVEGSIPFRSITDLRFRKSGRFLPSVAPRFSDCRGFVAGSGEASR
jgi:hypothetical protein